MKINSDKVKEKKNLPQPNDLLMFPNISILLTLSPSIPGVLQLAELTEEVNTAPLTLIRLPAIFTRPHKRKGIAHAAHTTAHLE